MATDQKISGASQTKQFKHDNLHQSAMDLFGVTKHLQDLLEKITGMTSENPKDCVNDQSNISLETVLTETPNFIQERISDIHQKIDEIEAVLF